MRILYIDIDCVRYDHLGSSGYDRPVSPNLDAVAAGGARLTDCHVSDAPCLPSRAALLTGRPGVLNGVVSHDGPASMLRFPGHGHHYDADQPMWMRLMQQHGWQTVSFSGFAQRHQAWWYGAGFTDNFGNKLPGHSESAEDVNNQVLPWLRTNAGSDDWFMHVHYYDAHVSYTSPGKYWDAVAAAGAPAKPHVSPDELAEDWERYYGPRTARDWWHQSGWSNPAAGSADPHQPGRMPAQNIDSYAEYASFLDGYDAGIRYVDDRVGELLAELRRQGLADDVAIIISSDHGESIGELGMYFEHGNCAEGTTHVPLIISWPGHTAPGTVVTGLNYQLDLPPTVLELLDIPVPTGWSGRSFAAALRGEPGQVAEREHLVCGTGIYSWQRAVRSGDYRLVKTLDSGLYPYDPVYLFDLVADPGQRHNLALDRPDVVAELDHVLLEWLMRYTTGRHGAPDPFAVQLAAGVSPNIYCSAAKMRSRLIDQNRVDQLADLDRRLAG